LPRRSEEDRPHDVLVPEEFPIGTGDAERPGPRVAPPDPSGPGEAPHDVLVAEEFPIGTADAGAGSPDSVPPAGSGRPLVAAAVAALGGAVAGVLLRRRRS
jgi:hypothetical protein